MHHTATWNFIFGLSQFWVINGQNLFFKFTLWPWITQHWDEPKMKFQVSIQCIFAPLSKALNHLKIYIVVLELQTKTYQFKSEVKQESCCFIVKFSIYAEKNLKRILFKLHILCNKIIEKYPSSYMCVNLKKSKIYVSTRCSILWCYRYGNRALDPCL